MRLKGAGMKWLGFGLVASVAVLLISPLQASAAESKARPVCPTSVGKYHCMAQVAVDENGKIKTHATIPPGYGPAQFHSAYALASKAATQRTIAIVDANDNPNARADLTTYSNTMGIPDIATCKSPKQQSPCFIKVNQKGVAASYPKVDQGWALESSLDIQIAHAICQNCKIVLVEANSENMDDLGAAENTAAALGANVISNSWGGSESSDEVTMDSYFNHPGTAITVSSGDSGYGASYPAASPLVTAVGGTTLNLDANNQRSGETVWSGSGSGCSAYEPQPAWQKALKLKGCAKRMIADIAAVADPNTGAAVYDSTGYEGQSGWFQVGGTSLSAPLIAGVYALSGSRVTTAQGLYTAASFGNNIFNVTSGSNSDSGCTPSFLCNAGVGWSGPTGLGTPIGAQAF